MEITGNLGTTFHFSGFGAPLELGRGLCGLPNSQFPAKFLAETGTAHESHHYPRDES